MSQVKLSRYVDKPIAAENDTVVNDVEDSSTKSTEESNARVYKRCTLCDTLSGRRQLKPYWRYVI